MFPIFLDLTGRVAVVVGGGPVGRRKALALLDGGATVRVVALEPASLQADHLDWRTEPYQSHHLHGASLVFAAATRDVNRQVLADPKDRGVWVNCADEPETGH